MNRVHKEEQKGRAGGIYPLLMGCLSLAVWREGEKGKKNGKWAEVG